MKLMGKFLKIKSLFPTLELCHAIIVLMILMFTTAQEFKRRPFEKSTDADDECVQQFVEKRLLNDLE